MKLVAYLIGITLILSSLYISQSPNVHVPLLPDAKTTSAASVELMGYAWSENIGWISVNCANTSTCGVSNYKVTLDTTTNNLSGYAWSEHIGWIQFGGLTGCPAGTCNARMEGSELKGWAKVVAGDTIPAVPVVTNGTSTYATPTTTTFMVPTGITSITAKVWGAGGGSGATREVASGPGGGGGFAQKTITVTPGEPLNVTVGSGGGGGQLLIPGTAGSPGGAVGGTPINNWHPAAAGGGGGGYSGIFRGTLSQANALLIAGGGGGSGGAGTWGYTSTAGAGGGSGGQNSTFSGMGGTQIAGGTGVNNGAALLAGAGGAGRSYGGGGGGGGYFGGGGGTGVDSDATTGSGGGGSAFGSGATLTAGSGITPPNTSDSAYVSGVGVGGAADSSASAWNVSAAVYSKLRSVASEDTSPQNIVFNTDGSKMFMVGRIGVDIIEYTLSVGFDIATATFVDSFPVSAQDSQPRGLAFNTSGTKMFVLASTGDEVNEYNLSTAFDVSTASYDSVFSIGAQETEPRGIAFSADGTRMYVVGQTNDRVYQYSLTTAFDVSTASYASISISVVGQTLNSRSITFKPDGTRMYVLGDSEGVQEYSLSSAWNVSTASFVQTFPVTEFAYGETGLFFKPDGTKMFVLEQLNDRLYEYNLTATPAGPGTAGGPGLVELTYSSAIPAPINGSDGWISLSSTNGGGGTYGVQVGATELTGFAWGSDVVGWISMNCSDTSTCADSNYRVYFNSPCSVGYACTVDNSASVYTDPWCATATTTCNSGEMCRTDMGSICGPGNPTGQLMFTGQRVRKGNTTQISWPALAAYDMCRVQGTPSGGTSDSWSWSSTTPLANVTTSAIQNEVTYTLECTQIGDVSATYQLLDTERVTLLPNIREF